MPNEMPLHRCAYLHSCWGPSMRLHPPWTIWVRLFVAVCISGCSRNDMSRDKLQETYVLRCLENDRATWQSLSVSGGEGVTQVRAWIRSHESALAAGKKLGPNLSWRPSWQLYRLSGKEIESYVIMPEIPKGAIAPKSEIEMLVNIPAEDLEALRQIFKAQGAPTGWTPP